MDLSIIKELRKKQGLSQRALANMLDVSPSYIQKIECNKKNPSISTLRKISSALNIELSLLLNDTNEDKSSSFNSNSEIPNYIPLEKLFECDECIDKNISIADKLDDVNLLENLYRDKLISLKNKYEYKLNILEDENNKLRLSLSYLDAENRKLINKIDNLNSSNNEQVSILSKFFKIPKIEHDKDYNENEEYESIGE